MYKISDGTIENFSLTRRWRRFGRRSICLPKFRFEKLRTKESVQWLWGCWFRSLLPPPLGPPTIGEFGAVNRFRAFTWKSISIHRSTWGRRIPRHLDRGGTTCLRSDDGNGCPWSLCDGGKGNLSLRSKAAEAGEEVTGLQIISVLSSRECFADFLWPYCAASQRQPSEVDLAYRCQLRGNIALDSSCLEETRHSMKTGDYFTTRLARYGVFEATIIKAKVLTALKFPHLAIIR